MWTSVSPLEAALLALCPGRPPDRIIHEAPLWRRALGLSSSNGVSTVPRTGASLNHATSALALLRCIGWCAEGPGPGVTGEYTTTEEADCSPAHRAALEALIGVIVNDGPEIAVLSSELVIGADDETVAAKTSAAAERRLDAWAEHAHAIFAESVVGGSGRLHPSVEAALRAVSPRALSAVLTPATVRRCMLNDEIHVESAWKKRFKVVLCAASHFASMMRLELSACKWNGKLLSFASMWLSNSSCGATARRRRPPPQWASPRCPPSCSWAGDALMPRTRLVSTPLWRR